MKANSFSLAPQIRLKVSSWADLKEDIGAIYETLPKLFEQLEANKLFFKSMHKKIPNLEKFYCLSLHSSDAIKARWVPFFSFTQWCLRGNHGNIFFHLWRCWWINLFDLPISCQSQCITFWGKESWEKLTSRTWLMQTKTLCVWKHWIESIRPNLVTLINLLVKNIIKKRWGLKKEHKIVF